MGTGARAKVQTLFRQIAGHRPPHTPDNFSRGRGITETIFHFQNQLYYERSRIFS